MKAIECCNLTKKYKDVCAVDNLSFSIEEGELCALLGVNGAGKSTTIRMLSTLTPPTSGDAFLNGYSITKDKQRVKEIIAISPQETAIAPNLTVKENIAFFSSLYGFDKEKRERINEEIIEKLELSSVLKRRAGSLSGGWQRRVSIALSLISEPKILFLDEPTLGLDVIIRNELLQFISSLKRKITIVLTTHYLEEAEALSDRVIIIKEGMLIEQGTVSFIKNVAGEESFDKAFIKLVGGGTK